jgi:hypothetical protein
MSHRRSPLHTRERRRFIRPEPMANPDSGRADPLYWDAVRFVLARGRVGTVGLMRRFNIGRQRAYDLLIGMRAAGVLYPGHWRGVYRPMGLAWRWLQLIGTHADAPSSPGAFRLYLDGHPAYARVPGWRAAA